MNSHGVTFPAPPERIEAVAKRAAELLVERQRPTSPELLTVDEVTELLRCRGQRVYDLVSQGRLRCLNDGSRVLIRRADRLDYLRGEA